ncbi:MAG: Haloacid dehalogenase-like hydrolase [Pseudomonadota bacterium]|jgi:phosphoglycolate phosphatase-like HAD superfamily hydrolase
MLSTTQNKNSTFQSSRNSTILSSLNIVDRFKTSRAKAKYPNTFQNLSKPNNINKDTQIVFVFDIDDTLVKTMQLIFNCFKDATKNLTKQRQSELVGKNLQEFTDKFLDKDFAKGKIDIMTTKIEEQLKDKEKLASSPRADYDSKYKDVDIISNAISTLELLKKIKQETGLNIKTVLFSNNYMDNLESSPNCQILFKHADAVFASDREWYKDGDITKSRPIRKGKPETPALIYGLDKNNISVESGKSIFFGIGDRKTDITVFDNLRKEKQSHIGSCFYLDTHSRAREEAKHDSIAVDVGNNHKDVQEWIKLATSMIKQHIDNQSSKINSQKVA